ncbi:MAG: hypothetical protein V4550_14650 [Gemmatimonadota bacterium]
MIRSFARRRVVAVAFAAASLACSGQEAPKVPLGEIARGDSAGAAAAAHGLIGPAAKAELDSGNALFRRKDYPAALEKYRSASALAPQHAAPFFGIYMVARATKNTPMADSALADIRRRNGPLAPAPHTLKDSVLGRVHEVIRKKAMSS